MADLGIHWFRRDLRLSDNTALSACVACGAVVPLFIHDGTGGAAQNWQLHQELASLAADLRAVGSRLILRIGDPATVLLQIAQETGAQYVSCQADVTDSGLGQLTAALAEDGIVLAATQDSLLGRDLRMADKTGGYRLFTPFWWRVERMDLEFSPLIVARPPAPQHWPDSLALDELNLCAPMQNRGQGLATHGAFGRAGALRRLQVFQEQGLANYQQGRDSIWPDGSSGLSTALAFGTLSVREVWAACPNPAFRRQLAWREFAAHLWAHFPQMEQECWAEPWRSYYWETDSETLATWQQGRTGCDIIDAAMRALWVTGRMHNRLRMVVASYLTKNLGQDWRAGQAWFADTLVDFDRASNAMGWQWVAGCGPDAAPYYRIFNPNLQADRHDPEGAFRQYWLQGEGAAQFEALRPASWPSSRRSAPDLKLQRQIALGRWQVWRDGLGRTLSEA